jgi:hypothetical protein
MLRKEALCIDRLLKQSPLIMVFSLDLYRDILKLILLKFNKYFLGLNFTHSTSYKAIIIIQFLICIFLAANPKDKKDIS